MDNTVHRLEGAQVAVDQTGGNRPLREVLSDLGEDERWDTLSFYGTGKCLAVIDCAIESGISTLLFYLKDAEQYGELDADSLARYCTERLAGLPVQIHSSSGFVRRTVSCDACPGLGTISWPAWCRWHSGIRSG